MFWSNYIFCRKYLQKILYCTDWLQLAEVAAPTVDHPRQEAVINRAPKRLRTRALLYNRGNGTGSPTLYRLSYGTDNASEMLWEGNVAHGARGLSLCHQRCTIWNNYEFIFIGTQTHLPQKLFFPRISATLFRKCWKIQHLKTRQEEKVSEILFLGETCPATFSTGGQDAFPVPPFGAHVGTNTCKK